VKYRLRNKDEAEAAFEYLTKLVGLEAVAEVKKYGPKRTNQQNRYYWLLLHAFSSETGYEVSEAEYIFKMIVNPDILTHERDGIRFPSSSTKLTTAQMATAIDRFHKYSAEAGFPLPQAHNEDDLIALENRYEA